MLRRMTHLLGNASVTLKLALGFALVLALSLVIAVTGWQALAASLYRSQTLSVLAQLAVAGEELRTDRILYRTLDDAESLSRLSASWRKSTRPWRSCPTDLRCRKPFNICRR